VRDSVGEPFDVLEAHITTGIPDECYTCGCPLPESKKRQLKAENLILRAKLARATDLEDATDDLSAARFKAEEIAEKAIGRLHDALRANWQKQKEHSGLLTEFLNIPVGCRRAARHATHASHGEIVSAWRARYASGGIVENGIPGID